LPSEQKIQAFEEELEELLETHGWTQENSREKAIEKLYSLLVPLEQTKLCHAFISYRREGGSETARLIYQGLGNNKIRTFLDVEDLSSGHFDERLLREIEALPNFIVILTPGCLDRCKMEGDWFRREIEHAIATERNIIPVLKDGFKFPPINELPPLMAKLNKHSGVLFDHVYFSSTLEKIISFMHK
jgi:hypothetical protein